MLHLFRVCFTRHYSLSLSLSLSLSHSLSRCLHKQNEYERRIRYESYFEKQDNRFLRNHSAIVNDVCYHKFPLWYIKIPRLEETLLAVLETAKASPARRRVLRIARVDAFILASSRAHFSPLRIRRTWRVQLSAYATLASATRVSPRNAVATLL